MRLERYAGNPILLPDPLHHWEALNVFNAAIAVHNGLFHMLYRGQGLDYVSYIGYAVSPDGTDWWRMDRPVYQQGSPYESRGVEDPRITQIGDTFYMLYTAYSPYGIRLSLAETHNFVHWERRGIILPEEDNKDGVLFPGKIRGRYCLMHRRHPDIWIAYSDNLLHWDDHQAIMRTRPGAWESERIGAAGPPIYTPRGWLLVYHGVDDERVYRLGVALLDLENPAVVLKRQEEPILQPEEPWEIRGDVPNVVFSCGAVLREDGALWVYYGGADRVMALAIASAEQVKGFWGG